MQKPNKSVASAPKDPAPSKASTSKGLLWSAIDRFALQGINFVFGIILARILSPEDFGVLGILMVFISISQTFIDFGLSTALIRMKEVTDEDYDTTFVASLCLALTVFALLFVTAPAIESFYNVQNLTEYIRVIASSLIFNVIAAIHQVKFTRQLNFKSQALASTSAFTLSGILAIGLAWYGCGVWSLVAQQVAIPFLNLAFLAATLKWFPKFKFTKAAFDRIFPFGSRVFAANMIDRVYGSSYNMIIGKLFQAEQLGYYTRANHMGQYPSVNVCQVIWRVMFPTMSKIQQDKDKLHALTEQFFKIIALVIFPLMFGLCAVAEPITIVLFGTKWVGAVPFLHVLALVYTFYPIMRLNDQLLYVVGRSDLVLRLELKKKVIGIVILAITCPFGILAMCFGRLVTDAIAAYLSAQCAQPFVGMSISRQLKAALPAYALSAVMALATYALIPFIPGPVYVQLMVAILFGMCFYALFAIVLKLDAALWLLDFIKAKMFKK